MIPLLTPKRARKLLRKAMTPLTPEEEQQVLASLRAGMPSPLGLPLPPDESLSNRLLGPLGE